MKEARNPAAVALLVLLAVLPLLPTLVFILRSPWPDGSADDDLAILELRTMEAGRGRHLVGPYSRFGWSHPGPAEFYLLYPFHLLSGRKTAGLGLGAVFANIAAAAGLAWVAVRILGTRRGAILVLLFPGLVLTLGPGGAGSAWNPHITVLPFALYLVLAAAVALEGPGYLPAAAVVGSFLVQTHLGYAPVTAAVAIAALWEWRRRRDVRAEWPRLQKRLAVTAVLLFVMWLPPLVEQIRESPGNMTLIARFLGWSRTLHTFAEVSGAMVGPLASVPLRLATLLVPSTSDNRSSGSGTLVLLLVALLPLARSVAARRGDAPARVLSTLGLTSLVVAYWSVFSIRGEIFDYLVLWVAAAGFLGWAALSAVVVGPEKENASPWIRRGLLLAAALFALLATVSNARHVGSERPVLSERNEPVWQVTQAIRTWISKNGMKKPVLSIGTHDTWVPASGVFLNLAKAGAPFSIDEEWWSMFGRAFRPDGTESGTLVLGDATLHDALSPRPDYTLVGRGGDTWVYWLRDPAWLVRHLRRAAGRVLDAKGTRGDPAVVADGVVPEEGRPWKAPECLVLSSKKSFVTVAVPDGAVIGVVVSANYAESYDIAVTRDGTTFEPMGVVLDVDSHGMRERTVISPKLRGANAIRISPRAEGGADAIGEVSFVFDDEATPAPSPRR
jgi:hypothetical protein